MTYINVVFFGMFIKKAVKRDGMVADGNVAGFEKGIQNSGF
jgi:hypothetical protein